MSILAVLLLVALCNVGSYARECVNKDADFCGSFTDASKCAVADKEECKMACEMERESEMCKSCIIAMKLRMVCPVLCDTCMDDKKKMECVNKGDMCDEYEMEDCTNEDENWPKSCG